MIKYKVWSAVFIQLILEKKTNIRLKIFVAACASTSIILALKYMSDLNQSIEKIILY